MPPATTPTAAGKTTLTPAAERVINNATADRAAKLAASKAKRADVTTPLPFAVETLPDPPLFADDAPPPPVAAPNPQPPSPNPLPVPRSITLSSAVLYRDYTITISAGGLTLAAFGALLNAPLGDLALPFRVTVEHGGRAVTIEADGLTLDRLCDMLDQRLGVVQ